MKTTLALLPLLFVACLGELINEERWLINATTTGTTGTTTAAAVVGAAQTSSHHRSAGEIAAIVLASIFGVLFFTFVGLYAHAKHQRDAMMAPPQPAPVGPRFMGPARPLI
jgi:hypothetical protein